MKVKIFSFVIVLLLIIECIILYPKKQNEKKEVVEQEVQVKKEVSINDIISELDKNNIAFVNIKEDSDSYLVKVPVNGEKEQVINNLKSINNFVIKDYSLNIKDNTINGTITLKFME